VTLRGAGAAGGGACAAAVATSASEPAIVETIVEFFIVCSPMWSRRPSGLPRGTGSPEGLRDHTSVRQGRTRLYIKCSDGACVSAVSSEAAKSDGPNDGSVT